jgi:glycolate oxidase iron-sulfur subunit
MQHEIPISTLGPQGAIMAHAVEACVHCGFCLASCPTYRVLGDENDSPRGRIILMKEQLEGRIALEDMIEHVDRCLGCLACVTACPSGVEYGHLLAPFRARANRLRRRPILDQAAHAVVHATLPYPQRFRLAAQAGRFARPLRGALPAQFGAMVGLLPSSLRARAPLPELIPAQGVRRARVAFLVGCVQPVLAPQINAATLRVLARNGVEVLLTRGQGCCGALSMHTGEQAQARSLARANMRTFPLDVDAIITNVAGCGSGMHEYPLLFAGEPDEAAARAFAARVRDVSVFLAELGIAPPPPLPVAVRAAYHDACHLAHAQGVTQEPRALLRQIPNLTLVEIGEAEICCGSAGTYNMEQPAIAATLGARKADNVLAMGAQAVITGNIGCLTQIRTHLGQRQQPLPVWHTMEVLDMAYRQAVVNGTHN